jgi:hypothetical protein
MIDDARVSMYLYAPFGVLVVRSFHLSSGRLTTAHRHSYRFPWLLVGYRVPVGPTGTTVLPYRYQVRKVGVMA